MTQRKIQSSQILWLSGGGELIDDTTPQLGGNLDVNGFDILGATAAGAGVGDPVTIIGGDSTDDSGGLISLTAGDSVTGYSYGGDVNLTGGENLTNPYGYGGNVNITGGQGFSNEADYAGNVNIISGSATYGAAGSVWIRGGLADTGGNGGGYASGTIGLYAGDGNEYAGPGYVTIVGGSSGSNTGGTANGGRVRIEGGRGDGVYNGGNLDMSAGDAAPGTSPVGNTGNGGNVTLTGGEGGGENGNGGTVTIGGGETNTSTIAGQGDGGAVLIHGGDINANTAQVAGGIGGDLDIRGGYGGYDGTGGDVTITSGIGGYDSGNCGDIVLTPASSTGSGSDGAVLISQSTAPSVTTNKLYNVAGALTWNGTDLTAGGGGGYTYTLQSGTTYTAVAGDFVAASNTGTVTITLPSVHTVDDTIIVKKIGATGTVTVGAAGSPIDTIDGASTFVLTVQWESVTLISDGTNWLIV